jgi:hypothetical protein
MSPSSKHVVRHYVEMVIAMFVGMGVLGFPAASAMGALIDDTPALMFLRMATTMTVGMVVWMRYRGHGWRANTEMAASMFLPTFGVIGLLWAGLLTNLGVLMVVEHVAMLLAMASVMLMRPAEYSHHDGMQVEPAVAEHATA